MSEGRYFRMNDCYQLGVLIGSQPRYLKLKLVIITSVLRSLLIGLTFKIKMILNGSQKGYLKMNDC